MKTIATLSAACMIVVAMSGASLAQGYSSGYNHHPCYGGGAIWHHHASTAAEGYARGLAAMLYAQGVYNRMTAEARIAHAQAYAHELENRQRQVETYFNVRATNRQAQAAERGPRPTSEQLAKLARQSAPERLSHQQLDPDTGRIYWPAALMAAKYAEARAQLEQVFSYRAATGSIDAEVQQQVQQTTELMLAELKSDIRRISPMEYCQARSFLGSLAREAQIPVA